MKYKEKYANYISLLSEIIEYSAKEAETIERGGKSEWSLSQLRNIVLPEMTDLLTYAKRREILFKFGKKQRLLISTYLLTESLASLSATELGQKISKLQKIYNSL